MQYYPSKIAQFGHPQHWCLGWGKNKWGQMRLVFWQPCHTLGPFFLHLPYYQPNIFVCVCNLGAFAVNLADAIDQLLIFIWIFYKNSEWISGTLEWTFIEAGGFTRWNCFCFVHSLKVRVEYLYDSCDNVELVVVYIQRHKMWTLISSINRKIIHGYFVSFQFACASSQK